LPHSLTTRFEPFSITQLEKSTEKGNTSSTKTKSGRKRSIFIRGLWNGRFSLPPASGRSSSAYAREKDRRGKLKRSVTAAAKSAQLVQILYKSGLTDFQNVLDMERSLFQQQDSLAGSEGDVARNLIRLYKALGGGWSPDLEVNAREVTRRDQLQPTTME
jgi:hypothetical protein